MATENNDYVASMRIPRPLADRVQAFAQQRAEAVGARITFQDAVRFLIDRGLSDATRPSRRSKAARRP